MTRGVLGPTRAGQILWTMAAVRTAQATRKMVDRGMTPGVRGAGHD